MVQIASEGWTVMPPLEDADSGDSDLHAPPSSLEEEVPENLGDEWRILHPFDLPGIRHVTDTIPLNQRRLAENDALVELIQITEYLEDKPMWGQRDYQLYPIGMGIHATEVEGEAEEVVQEVEKQWEGMKGLMKEIQPEGLGEVMLEEILEGEMAEDVFPKVHSIEMKGITRLENGQILQVKGEGGMILICTPYSPRQTNREIYHLQPPPHQKIDSSWIGLVRGQDLSVRGHLCRMFQ